MKDSIHREPGRMDPITLEVIGEELIGFFAINCHWIDIGGSTIGSILYSST